MAYFKVTKKQSGSGGNTQIATGSFTSGTTSQQKTEINCGFEPDIVYVEMDFESYGVTGITKAIAKNGMLSSLWDLRPIENTAHVIIMGSETGETGITDFTSTGFKYRVNGSNTFNKACTYTAYKFS